MVRPAMASVARDTLSQALGYVATMQEESGGWSRLRDEFPADPIPLLLSYPGDTATK